MSVAQKSYKSSAQEKAGVKFPIGKLARFARRGKYADRIGQGAPIYMAGVLEYLTYELLELASMKAQGEGKRSSRTAKTITPRHIMLAVKSDEEFNNFLRGAEFAYSGRAPTYLDDENNNNKKKKKGQMEDEDEDADMHDPNSNQSSDFDI